jgi:peptide/nickel transport system substrate-binding protein
VHQNLEDFFGVKTENHDSIKDLKRTGLKYKLRLIARTLNIKQRYTIFALLLLMFGSLASVPFTSFYHFTTAQPDKGGTFTEGIVGEPRHINPLLSQANDPDRDMTALIYSGLLKNNKDGKLVPDLIKSYEISEDGLSYTIFLKDNAKWHNGLSVTADDVIFTVQTAQNSDYGSSQRFNWQGVTVEKINDFGVIFKLKNKYAQFLNNLTLGILPKHIWQEVKPINFALSEYNLKPIGSGPYIFDKLIKDKSGKIISYQLKANPDYYNDEPYISNLVIKFYESEDALIDAYNKNEIENLGFVSPKNISKIKFKQRLTINQLKLPRYYAIFFNQNQSKILSDKNVRLGLSYATNKQSIIDNVLDSNGIAIDSPLLEEITGKNEKIDRYEFDETKAAQAFKTAGYSEKNENGLLKNKDGVLSLKLTTSTWPELMDAANEIKNQWAKAGVEVTIEILPIPELTQAIKERNYQMLLFGEIMNTDPDPFSLWHSSQKKDPGLNLALYDNKDADKLLEEARLTLGLTERLQKYNSFEQVLNKDIPVIFLYNPWYVYPQTKRIKGFETKLISVPSDRFSDINKWYIDTDRSWGKKPL